MRYGLSLYVKDWLKMENEAIFKQCTLYLIPPIYLGFQFQLEVAVRGIDVNPSAT